MSLEKQFQDNPHIEDYLKILALDKFDYPNVSVLIPTYNRRKFLRLIGINLFNTLYPKNKLEVVIMDDGDEPLFINDVEVKSFSQAIGISVNYVYDNTRHLGIGEKRNKLVKLAKHKICINMDDDDLYFPQYIPYSVKLLKDNKAGIVGSPEMLFTYPHYDFKMSYIRCPAKRQCHEATFCFTKKHWKQMSGFQKNGNGEGSKMIDYNEKMCVKSNVLECMCCICHNNNTCDKEKFKDENSDVINVNLPDEYKDIIKDILK
jgi:glycosyltransferase involved in cell wall biosynthesis